MQINNENIEGQLELIANPNDNILILDELDVKNTQKVMEQIGNFRGLGLGLNHLSKEAIEVVMRKIEAFKGYVLGLNHLSKEAAEVVFNGIKEKAGLLEKKIQFFGSGANIYNFKIKNIKNQHKDSVELPFICMPPINFNAGTVPQNSFALSASISLEQDPVHLPMIHDRSNTVSQGVFFDRNVNDLERNSVNNSLGQQMLLLQRKLVEQQKKHMEAQEKIASLLRKRKREELSPDGLDEKSAQILQTLKYIRC